MGCVFIVAVLLTQQPGAAGVAPVDAAEQAVPAVQPPASDAEQRDSPQADVPVAQPAPLQVAPPPADEPPPAHTVPAPSPSSAATNPPREHMVGTVLTLASLAAGSPMALLCGLTAAAPAACLFAATWWWLSTPAGPPQNLRGNDALQLAVLFSPVVYVATCLAAPLGIPLALFSAAVGVMAPRKPTFGRMRAAAGAALPGMALAAAPSGAVAAGLLSSTVLVMSLAAFWLTYSPSLAPMVPAGPRIWHQVNNLACCCLGLSLLTTPALVLAWPVSMVGVCGAFVWTAWRAGRARAQVDCAPGAPCAEGGDP